MTSKLVLRATTAIACAVAAAPAAAQEVTTGVSLSVGGSYDSSPFLDSEGEGESGSVSGFAEVEPRISIADETSNVQLAGALRYAYFPALDRSNEAARLRLTGNSRIAEATSINASASFLTSRAIGVDLLRQDPDVLGPGGELPLPPDIDPTLVNQRGRTTSLGLSGGITHALSPVSNLSAGVFSNWRWFSGESLGGLGRESTTTGANLGYSRVLSERATLNVGVSGSLIDYEGSDFGDARTLTPTAGARIRISETGEISFGAGATFIRTDLGAFGKDNSVLASGNLSYCDRAIGGSLCLTGSRSAQATGTSGVSAVSALSLGWSRQLSERGSLSLSGRYARSSNSTLLVEDEIVTASTELYGVNARYRHRFNERFSGYAQASFTEATSSLVERKPNFGIMAGITVSLGNNR